MKKRGISLITLIITVIVMLILAAVVILALGKNTPINQAKVANITEVDNMLSASVNNYVSKIRKETLGEYTVEKILFGTVSKTEEYKLVDEVVCAVEEDGEPKVLHRLDKVKVKEKLDIELKEVSDKAGWYVDKIGKTYLVFETKEDVLKFLIDEENGEILKNVSSFVKYATDASSTLVLEISSNQEKLTNATDITYTFEFNNDVVDFDRDDIYVEADTGTKGAFTKISNRKYTLVVSNNKSVTQVVTVPKNACVDNYGTKNKSVSYETVIDKDIPTLTSLQILTAAGTYKYRDEISIAATYSEELYTDSKIKLLQSIAEAIPMVIRFGSGSDITVNADSIVDNMIIYKYTVSGEDDGVLSLVRYYGNIYDRVLNQNLVNETILPNAENIIVKKRIKGSISYANTTVQKTIGDAMFTNTLTKVGDGEVTYSSSDENVATIDENGIVTITGIGTTTITATVQDSEDYAYDIKTATYTLNVGKITVQIPSSPPDKTYTGYAQSHGISVPSGASIVSSGSVLSATEAGTYTVIFRLDNTTNYKWSDNTTSNKSVTWKIQKPPTITYTGSALTGTVGGTSYDLVGGGPQDYRNISFTLPAGYKLSVDVGDYGRIYINGSLVVHNYSYPENHTTVYSKTHTGTFTYTASSDTSIQMTSAGTNTTPSGGEYATSEITVADFTNIRVYNSNNQACYFERNF